MTSTEHHYSQQIDEGALIAGRYRLTRWLGLGAMGEVWAARDERLGRDVAVKLVLGDPQTDPETADRFTREAIAVARINHPNVVGVYDQGEFQRHQFVVMELVAGCNLDELRGGRQMPVGAGLAIGVQIARALEAAHEVGVLHRDIKPANIMVSHDGVVKVLDFGIAGFLQGAGFQERLTRTGADSLGTPAYTAPERIAGGSADPRSDLYSLGCVLYVLLTGLPPFPADDSLTILHRHLHDEPTPVRRWRPEVAPEIDQLVLWLLAKDPTARPASARVVVGRLESLASAYPNPQTAAAEQTLTGLGMFGADAAAQSPAPPLEPTEDRDRDRDRGRGRGRGRNQGSDNESGGGYVKTSRKRHAPTVFLIVSLVAGLSLGVVLSRQSTTGSINVIGAMPSADAPHAAGSTKAGGAAAAAKGTAGTGTGTGTGAGAGAAASSTTASAATNGSTAAKGSAPASQPANQVAVASVTPTAPVTPYLRYTATVPGNGGCVTLAPGQFECTVGRDGGAPVYQAGVAPKQIGSVANGAQPVYCQSSGVEYMHGGFKNHWWAWTESAQGNFGWVSAVDLSGGGNDQPEPGLPYCGN